MPPFDLLQREAGGGGPRGIRQPVVETQVVRLDPGRAAEQDRALEYVAQLPDVARPGIPEESGLRRGRESHGAPAQLGAEALEDRPGQEGNVRGPLREGWDDERKGADTEIQIAAEPLRPCQGD